MILSRGQSSELFVSVALKKLVHSDGASLQDLLELPFIAKAGRMGDDDFQSFIEKHCFEVLDYALANGNSSATTGAFKLLTCGEKSFMEKMVGDGKFRERIQNVLARDEIEPAVMGRLTTLTFNAVSKFPTDATYNECSFAFDLLSRADMQSVFEMFSAIIREGKDAQRWLERSQFASIIGSELEKIDFNHKSSSKSLYADPVYNRACHLYNLVYQCCRTAVLRDSFRTKEMIKCLQHTFVNLPDFVRNEQWKAIVLLADANTAPDCMVFVPEAIQILSEMPDKLTCYRETAIHFLAKMMSFQPKVYTMVAESSVPQTLISIALNFSSSTIIQNAFVAFVKAAVNDTQLAKKLIRYYVSVIIHFGSDSENRLLVYCFSQVLDILVNAAANDKQIANVLYEQHGVRKFVTSVLKPYQKQLRKSYGGKVPSQASPKH